MAPDPAVMPSAPTLIVEGEPVKEDAADEGSKPSSPREPQNYDHAIAEKAARAMLHRERPRGFYWPAKKLLEWGEVQIGRHASWSDLFWDLIFVGSAFKVGDFFKTNVGSRAGPLVLVGTGLTIVNSWSHLLQYRCRFEASSLLHKIVDVLEGLAVAAAAHNVVEDVSAFEAYHMYTFLVLVLCARAVQGARRLELAVREPPAEEYGSTRYAALDMLVRTLLEMSLLCVGFFFSSLEGVMGVLISVWLVQVTLFTAPALLGWYHKRHLVPIHVEYAVRRMGEMVMLMLGEGMLSLVLSNTAVDTTDMAACFEACWLSKAKGAVSFVSGFVLLTCLMYLYYRCNRFTRHHHAVRRSAWRGIAWNTMHWPLCLSLITTGVCLKSIQPYAALPGVKREYVYAFGVATAFSMLTTAAQQLMHPGLQAFVHAPKRQGVRLGLFALKLGLSVAPAAVVGFPETTEGWVYTLYAMLLAVSSIGVLLLEKGKEIERGLWAYADHKPGRTPGDEMYHERGGSVTLPQRSSRHGSQLGVLTPDALLALRASQSAAHLGIHSIDELQLAEEAEAGGSDGGAGEGEGEGEGGDNLPVQDSDGAPTSCAPSAVASLGPTPQKGRSRVPTPKRPTPQKGRSLGPTPKHARTPVPRSPRRQNSIGGAGGIGAIGGVGHGAYGAARLPPAPYIGSRRHTWDVAALSLAAVAAAESAAAESDTASDISSDLSVDLPHHMYELGVREDEFTEAEDVNSAVVLTG